MPRFTQETTVILRDDDLPKKPGESVLHEVGPYAILIEMPVPAALAQPQLEPEPSDSAGEAEDARARFVPVTLDLKVTRYRHAAELFKPEGSSRTQLAQFALCNGKKNGRRVRDRDRRHTLSDVDCPRCWIWLERAGITRPNT